MVLRYVLFWQSTLLSQQEGKHSAHSIPNKNVLDSHRFHGFFAIGMPKGVKYNYWVFFSALIIAIVVNIARDQRIYATKIHSVFDALSNWLWISVVFCRGNIR